MSKEPDRRVRKMKEGQKTGPCKGGAKWKTGLFFWASSDCYSFCCDAAEPEWAAAVADIPKEVGHMGKKKKRNVLTTHRASSVEATKEDPRRHLQAVSLPGEGGRECKH